MANLTEAVSNLLNKNLVAKSDAVYRDFSIKHKSSLNLWSPWNKRPSYCFDFKLTMLLPTVSILGSTVYAFFPNNTIWL